MSQGIKELWLGSCLFLLMTSCSLNHNKPVGSVLTWGVLTLKMTVKKNNKKTKNVQFSCIVISNIILRVILAEHTHGCHK